MIPDVSGLSTFEAAIRYVNAGYRVFPTEGKEPVRGFDWDSDAWSDEGQVREFWGTAPSNEYGIGMPMSVNGMVAVDMDHPEHVAIEVHNLLDTAGAIQMSDQSAMRGHYIWRTDKRLGNSTARFPGRGAGLDVRGTGYLIVAPTVHARTGQPYTWILREPTKLPDQFSGWFSPPGPAAAAPATDDEVSEFLAEYHEALAPHKLDERVSEFQRIADKNSRNNAALSVFGEAFRESRAGCYPAQAVWDKLREALDQPDPYEEDRAQRLLRLGVSHAILATDDDLDRLRPTIFPVLETRSEDDFWESRATLRTIRQAAKARLINPYALLGAVLVDVVAATPPTVQLETFGGAKASLNLFVALCGSSGSGKTMTGEAVRDVIRIQDRTSWENLRSGEGLVSCYVTKKGQEVIRLSDRAVVEIDEIDRLTALGSRSGATIMPTLRSAWVGATLGGRAATASVDLSVQHNSYRCCLVAGVQPGRSRALFDDADGGTPQRFVWLPANDPEAELGHEWPSPISWSVETDEPSAFNRSPVPDRDLTLPASVIEEWQQERLMRARGQGDELDSHRMLATAKMAAGFALLEMHSDVTEDDWAAAQHLMNISIMTRARLKAELARNAEAEALSRGRMSGISQAAADEAAESAVLRRARAKVEKLRQQGLSRSEVSQQMSRAQREYLDQIWPEEQQEE